MTLERISDTPSAGAPTATVLICTFNRAPLLDETLESLSLMAVPPDIAWDVLIVDNASTDNTAEIVRARQVTFPVPLRYLYEARSGKSYALNTGIAASNARFIVFTDDDVRVDPGWLPAAISPMLRDSTVAYTGGPVRPIWGAPRPPWLDAHEGHLWGTIAILDYGDDPFCFEERGRIPLGANMAVRRTLFDSVGVFDPALGRIGTSLRGQEQAEFFYRTRAHGARGHYEPGMTLHHHVPAARLTRNYFRRWWFWKGRSQARLSRMHRAAADPLAQGQRESRLPIFSRFILGSLARHVRGALGSIGRSRWTELCRHEMMGAYYLGFAWEQWQAIRERKRNAAAAAPGGNELSARSGDTSVDT